MRMWKYWAATLVLATTPLAAHAQQAGRAEFHAGGVDFTMPLPKGFCLPSDAAGNAVAQLISAADGDNLTLLVLFDCNGTPGVAMDYFVIKIPTPMLMMAVTREQVVREVSAAMGTAEFRAATAPDKINTDSAKAIGGVLNTEVEIDSAFGFSGHDDVCVYMKGVIVMRVAERQIKGAVAACMTAVGGRMMTIYRYSDGNVAGRATEMVPLVRAVAETITEKTTH